MSRWQVRSTVTDQDETAASTMRTYKLGDWRTQQRSKRC